MTRREQRLLIFFGVFACLGAGIGLYYVVYSPWQTAKADAVALQKEYDDKHFALEVLEGRATKLKILSQRSLPGDLDVASSTYRQMIAQLMRESGTDGNGSTVEVLRSIADAHRVPTTQGKTPAYTRIGFTIVLKKIDLPKLTKFLEKYYQQPVLQQITTFDVKRTDNPDGGRKSGNRADLEAKIVTEAVIVDGAPRTAALPAAPPGMKPLLARGSGDYALLEAKDPFHGSLPPIWVNGPEPTKPKEYIPPPDDISAFIRLQKITWRGDGTATADIYDVATNNDYEISRELNKAGALAISVTKYFHQKGERHKYDTTEDLIISEPSTATNRHFKVLEIAADGLILSEQLVAIKPAAVSTDDEEAAGEENTKIEVKDSKGSKPTSKTPGKGYTGKTQPGSKTAKPAAAATPKLQQAGALVGALAFVTPAEKRYLWPVGATLRDLKELGNGAKAKEEPPMPRETEE